MTDENSFCFDDSFTVDDVDCHVSKLKDFLENLSLNDDFRTAGQILQDCFSSCTNQQLNEKVFEVILPIAGRSLCQLLDTIEEKLNNLGRGEASDNLKQSLLMCQELLSFWEKSVEYISGGENLSATQVKSLIDTSPEILKLVFQHCKTSSEAYGIIFDRVSAELANLFHKANTILKQFLTTLDCLIAFDRDSQVETELLVNVIDIIGSIMTIANGMDLKMHVEVSRAFGKLAIKHQEVIKHVSTAGVTPHLGQLTKDLCLLLSTFKNAGTEIEERTVKASGFLLKILEKLLLTYSSVIDSDVLMPLFELLLHMHRCLPSCLKSSKLDEKTIDLVQRHFPLGSESFLNIALKLPDFRQIFFEYSHRENIDPLGYHLLTLSIMSKLTYEHQTEWICGAESIIDIAFTTASKIQEHVLLGELRVPGVQIIGERARQASIYEATLVSICSLMIHVPPEHFHILELLLLKHLLTNRFWGSLLSMDAWCFIGRLGSSELCASHVKYLLKVYAALSERRSSLEVVVLETLIGRLYTLLSEKTKHSLVTELNDFETDSWTPLFRLLPKTSQLFIEEKLAGRINKMHENFGELQRQPGTNNWNRLKRTLSLARVSSCAGDKAVATIILQLWVSVGNAIEDAQGRDMDLLSDFIISLLNATQLKSLQHDVDPMTQVLKSILRCCACFSPFVKVAVLHYLQENIQGLDNCSSSVTELLAELICRLLEEPNPWVHQEALETFDNISHTCPNVNLVTTIAGCVATNDKSSISETVPAYLLHTLHYQVRNYTSVQEYLSEVARHYESEHVCVRYEESRRKEKYPRTEPEPSEGEFVERLGRLVTDLNRFSKLKSSISRNTLQRIRADLKKLEVILESVE